MDLVVYDDDDHRYVPWLVSIAAVLAAAVLAAGVTFLLARQGSADELSGSTGGVAATAPSAQASPEAADDATAEPSAAPSAAPPTVGVSADCREALDQADLALETSVALEQALAAQTRVMDDLLASRLTTAQALDQSLPVLTRAATDRRQFAAELSAFRASRQGCE